jgi:hypothetical protein
MGLTAPEIGALLNMTPGPGRCIGAALHRFSVQQQEQGENLFHLS